MVEKEDEHNESGIVDHCCISQSATKAFNQGKKVGKKWGRKLEKQKREEIALEKGLTSIKEYMLRSKGANASRGGQ